MRRLYLTCSRNMADESDETCTCHRTAASLQLSQARTCPHTLHTYSENIYMSGPRKKSADCGQRDVRSKKLTYDTCCWDSWPQVGRPTVVQRRLNSESDLPPLRSYHIFQDNLSHLYLYFTTIYIVKNTYHQSK